jgi:four helix bundle protein
MELGLTTVLNRASRSNTMNYQNTSTNNQINSNSKNQNAKTYDLEERTLEFGKRIIRLCKSLPNNNQNKILNDQLLRSGTSIGANYREANETETAKNFRNRVGICRKEAKETNYWLKMIIEANPSFEKRIQNLLTESMELVKIFAAIQEKSRRF